ncbi:hypothetical protein COBT_001950 [Conglomerata obtusa]
MCTMILNSLCFIIIYLFCVTNSDRPSNITKVENKYNIKNDIFLLQINRFKETLYNLLYANTKKSQINIKRIETHVNCLSEPFFIKIELFNELGNSIEHEKFARFLKYDKLCIEKDKERLEEHIGELIKKENIKTSLIVFRKRSIKLREFFEEYKNSIKKILGEDHLMIKSLYKNRKDIHEAYDNLGTLDGYTKHIGNNALCIQHINKFTINLHESINNSYK